MIVLLRTISSLSIIAATAFVTDQCQWICSRRRHQHQQCRTRRGSSLIAARTPTLFTSHEHPSTARDITLRAHQNELVTASKYSSIQLLLSSEERHHIEHLVHERSISRWNGDFETADKIRSSIDDIRIFIPWNRILQTIIDDENRFLKNVTNIMPRNDDDIRIEYKVMITDIPRSDGGGSYWELIPIDNHQLLDIVDHNSKKENVLQLAHAALGMAVSASERGVDMDTATLNNLIRRAVDRLQAIKQMKALSNFLPGTSAAATVGELHGRKAADAILWFALAGYNPSYNNEQSDDTELYSDLVEIATEELQRFGMNSSCRAKDVLHIVERIAMAGIGGTSSQRLYRLAAQCLEVKMDAYATIKDRDINDIANKTADTAADANANSITDDDAMADEKEDSIDYESIIQSLRDYSFGLHSDRSLLGLWRFSTRQRKQRAFFMNAARHFEGTYEYQEGADTLDDTFDYKSKQYDWSTVFKDPSRPLVIDVGCGMGVSLLGLASNQHINDDNEMHLEWSECNFVGVDQSRLAIGYANGVCSRWGLEATLAFLVDSAEECLIKISESYPGRVPLIMLQFPTPFRFPNIANDDDVVSDEITASTGRMGFNTQLPEGAESNDFMVTERLLALTHAILSNCEGKLLIQSNCEDVAVHMRNASMKVGFRSITVKHPVTSVACVTQRAHRWIGMGGERAIGGGWSQKPLLPLKGRTETEVACVLDGKPVHRCIIQATA
ncbi:hypothetical protein ACHAWU_004030 [Discostella pseudostelligera]|uniref:tRNA (guanine(46)-N(7))-methyltransferase n=1 Tax=Discostella pseudostelligera TaxID=259834 RepID=A0ABD3MKE4_9STRA